MYIYYKMFSFVSKICVRTYLSLFKIVLLLGTIICFKNLHCEAACPGTEPGWLCPPPPTPPYPTPPHPTPPPWLESLGCLYRFVLQSTQPLLPAKAVPKATGKQVGRGRQERRHVAGQTRLAAPATRLTGGGGGGAYR